MKSVQGNLLKMAKEDQFDIILHGANCFKIFGAGIAKQIKEVFPEAYIADLDTIEGDKTKLGRFTFADCKTNTNKNIRVINLYTQYQLGACFDILAFTKAISKIGELERLYTARTGTVHRIGFPAIGCGIGGGTWLEVSPIIEKALTGLDFTYVEFVEV